MMKVSVVITTYNRPTMVPEAIQSVKAQTYPDVELIVINDGGKPVEGAHYIKHVGSVGAANAGVRMSTGELVVRLDDDDLLTPHYIELCVKGIERGYDMAGIGNLSVDLFTHNTCDVASMFKREWYDRVDGYMRPPGSPVFLDWYFWLRCWTLGATFYDITEELKEVGELGHVVRKGHPRISDGIESDSRKYIKYRKLMLEKWKEWRKEIGQAVLP